MEVDGAAWEVLGGWLVVEDPPAEGEGDVGNRKGGARSWRFAIVFGRAVVLLVERVQTDWSD